MSVATEKDFVSSSTTLAAFGMFSEGEKLNMVFVVVGAESCWAGLG